MTIVFQMVWKVGDVKHKVDSLQPQGFVNLLVKLVITTWSDNWFSSGGLQTVNLCQCSQSLIIPFPFWPLPCYLVFVYTVELLCYDYFHSRRFFLSLKLLIYKLSNCTLHSKRDVHSICVVRVLTILFQTFFKRTNKYGASPLAASSAKRESDTSQLHVWERNK